MAHLEIRNFKSKKFLLITAETEEESRMIDSTLGKKIPTRVHGEVTLADGYCEHYIRLSTDKGDFR